MRLRSRAKLAFLNLMGVGGKGRHIRARPTDHFIIGYPKSGNTWLDFLVASLIIDRVENVDFKTINSIVGDVHTLSPWQLHRMQNPRYLKSHDYFCESFPKVVHIVRHPYDVAVSYYYFLIKSQSFDESHSLSDFVAEWVKGEWGSGFGTWESNARSWIEGAGPEKRHLLRYEDLKKDTEGELAAVANFFGISATPERISQAVKWCMPDNMHRLEKEGLSAGFKGLGDSRPDIAFVRTEKSSNRVKLSDADKDLIARNWEPLMNEFGYRA